MTLTLAITLIVVLDAALIAALAYVMSHAAKLTPHKPGVTGNHWRLRRPLHQRSARSVRGERVPAHFASALD
jgi:hypothetical protein